MNMNAFDLLGFQDMPFIGRSSKTLWHEIHSPQAFEDVCGQHKAVQFLKYTWDGTRPLFLVGDHGSGKTVLAQLATKHRGGRLVDVSELRSLAQAREYVRMHQGGPCYLHFPGGVHTAREILSVISQKVCIVAECTPHEAIADMRDALRKGAVCELARLQPNDMEAWLSKKIRFDHIIPGDMRATMLDAQTGARFGSRVDQESYDRLTSMEYAYTGQGEEEKAGNVVMGMAMAAEAISDGMCMEDPDMAAALAGCVERIGVGKRSVKCREWSTIGVAAMRRNVLRLHSSKVLPPSYAGSSRLRESVWCIPLKLLDKRGREIKASYSIKSLDLEIS